MKRSDSKSAPLDEQKTGSHFSLESRLMPCLGSVCTQARGWLLRAETRVGAHDRCDSAGPRIRRRTRTMRGRHGQKIPKVNASNEDSPSSKIFEKHHKSGRRH